MTDGTMCQTVPTSANMRPSITVEFMAVAALIGLVTVGGLELSQGAGRIPTLWPANGVLLAILLTTRPSKWPAFVLVAFGANVGGTLLWGYPVDIGLRFAFVNCFEVILALKLIRRFVSLDCDVSQTASLWRFALAAAVVAPALAVLLNAGLSYLAADQRSPVTFVASFLAHALGIVTATPVALAVRRRELLPLLDHRKAKETMTAFAFLLLTTLLVFSQSRYPLLFLILPPLVFVVFRCGLAGGALGLFFATVISIGLTVMGRGPTSIIVNATNFERLIVVQVFAATAAILVLTLSALLAERDRVQQALVAAKDELTRLATTDGLTGLHNRRRFDEALDEECRRAARLNMPLSLLLLDVDRFKAFNDRYGHPSGDGCLKAIAATMKTFGRRPGDIAARYGGEEFAIVLPMTDEPGALMVAEQVRRAIEAQRLPHAGNAACGGVVTVSIGIATATGRRPTYRPEDLIAAADDLLYEAKRTGRNKTLSPATRWLDPVPPALADEERRLVAVEAHEALANGRELVELDALAKCAADFLASPIGLITLVGRDRQVFIGRHGFEQRGTARDVSFCAHSITGEDPLVVPDATFDSRFVDNALVTGSLGLRFYAGAPLVTSQGAQPLGALCVLDRVAHKPLTSEERAELARLAGVAMRMIESLQIDEAA